VAQDLFEAPKITWASAFNFQVAMSEQSLRGTCVETCFKLAQIASEAVQRRFISVGQNRTTETVCKYVLEVSERAINHPLDVRRAVDLYVHPPGIFRRRYLDEVVAADAMLSSLEYLCDQGHIDTRILAELSIRDRAEVDGGQKYKVGTIVSPPDFQLRHGD